MTDVSRETPPVPTEALGVFALRLPLAERYAAFLADAGVERGLIGPREAPRLWDRHLLNCAVVEEILPEGCSVADLGSGAGLPGLVLAIARPDLRITLIEPLLRRTVFLEEAVELLGLRDQVTIWRGRADEFRGRAEFDRVTSRAVAALPKLAGWSVPLTRVGGEVVALKGSSAAEEVAAARKDLRRLGVERTSVETLGTGRLSQPTTVVRLFVTR
jgi:16S rRNA (guanine527-N7)-methyltransferase